MPRHNCSDLQRFAQNLDTHDIMNKRIPEVGPLYWTLAGRGGIARPQQKVTAIPQLKVVQGEYPIFSVDGHRYSAIRWLYFQLYDDRHLFVPKEAENYICANQTRLGVRMYTHMPHVMYYNTPFNYSPEWRTWNTMFWFNKHMSRYKKIAHEDYAPQSDLTITKWIKPHAKPFRRIRLVFPEYVGPERIRLVRHYLLGGGDHDRPNPNASYQTGTPGYYKWIQYAADNGIDE